MLAVVLLVSSGDIDTPLAASARCPGTTVVVSSADPEELRHVCRAAGGATELLARCGIVRDGDLSVALTKELRHPCGFPVLGQYLARADRIELMEYSSCVASFGEDSAYMRLPLREAWRSLAVHEITHGIIAKTPQAGNLSPMAHEYVAYVIQLEAMAPEHRQAFLDSLPAPTPRSLGSFNSVYHAFEPLKFAANAYRHYAAQEDRCAFLNAILRGTVAFPKASD